MAGTPARLGWGILGEARVARSAAAMVRVATVKETTPTANGAPPRSSRRSAFTAPCTGSMAPASSASAAHPIPEAARLSVPPPLYEAHGVKRDLLCVADVWK